MIRLFVEKCMLIRKLSICIYGYIVDMDYILRFFKILELRGKLVYILFYFVSSMYLICVCVCYRNIC